jgi:NADPH:quinone reductase-like Zn-dependent oxidoreductase
VAWRFSRYATCLVRSPGPTRCSSRSELGIAKDRIDTIVDPSIQKYGVKLEGGAAAASAATLAELAEAVAAGDLVVPIQRSYPLDDVRAAFAELEAGHMAGKIVLMP